ncbi:hypothetical protein V5P93_003952 [Actinokineospora auranticolor]|uniref:Uncharacterized protein n=1 Tax=Actinokineospora auranticolor TaxID=155976 RepID=A0A2S6GLW9_9PSEU|nr:hypothetical protein [Actinokineospora auranticolor]PPK66232.1 hypothetical protein CLV40_111196 [Actinokineospora auranticolor]
MDSSPRDNADDIGPDKKNDDPSTTRNSLSGSGSAVVQARDIRGGITQNAYHSPGRMGWTALLVCLLILGGLLLVNSLNDDPPVQSGIDDAEVPLVAAAVPAAQRCSSNWFTPKPVTGMWPRLHGGGFQSWTDVAPLADGASADTGEVMVTLQGRRPDRGVVITGITVEVLSRDTPPQGVVLNDQCGAPSTTGTSTSTSTNPDPA